MAQNTTVSVPAETWTQLTDADVSAATFQNVSQHNCYIMATVDTTAPTSLAGALRYAPSSGEVNRSLADLFVGLSTPVRLWAYSSEAVRVVISHA